MSCGERIWEDQIDTTWSTHELQAECTKNFSQKTRRACRSGWNNTVSDTEVTGVCGNEMDSSGPGQGLTAGSCECCIENSVSISGGELLDPMKVRQLCSLCSVYLVYLVKNNSQCLNSCMSFKRLNRPLLFTLFVLLISRVVAQQAVPKMNK